MASSVNPHSSFSRFQDSANSFDHRPRILKEFLRDDDHCHSCSSLSTTGMDQLYPRKKPWKSTVLISSKSNNPSMVLLRSQSKAAATSTISAIHRVFNLVKLFPFASVKSPLVLPRSISRKLSRRSKDRNEILQDYSEVKVKVKDILRWTSFRDLEEEKSTPLDFTSIQIKKSTSSSSSCSKRSSWSQSGFTAEDLPLWCSETSKDCLDKNCLLGQPATNDRLRNLSKVEWSFEECDEQQSPVSVLDDSPFLEDEESISPNYRNRANNIERRKCILTRRIQESEVHSCGGETAIFEDKEEEAMSIAAEEKAKKLLSRVRETTLAGICESHDDDLMLDFFKHELSINEKLDDVEFDCKILEVAKSWVIGEYEESFEWEVEYKRDAYVKDMERGVGWNAFRHEQEEISKELQIEVLSELIDEVLIDFLIK